VEILDEIKRIIAKDLRIPVEQLSDDTGLENLGADSMDIIEIVYDIEEKFEISIPFRPGDVLLTPNLEVTTESTVNLGTIGEIAQAVKSLLDAKSHR
jgi:acyl carrier protein